MPVSCRLRLPALLLALAAAGASAADNGEARLRSFLSDVQAMDGKFRQQVIDSRQQVLEDTNFDRDRAASILGVSGRALSTKLGKLGIKS